MLNVTDSLEGGKVFWDEFINSALKLIELKSGIEKIHFKNHF